MKNHLCMVQSEAIVFGDFHVGEFFIQWGKGFFLFSQVLDRSAGLSLEYE